MQIRVYILIIIFFVSSVSVTFAEIQPYFYPFINPYEATVVPLPTAYKAKLPVAPSEVVKLKIHPERKIPPVFWYQDGLVSSISLQRSKAPLIFLVAGTGASYKASTMIGLTNAFYNAGYHVVCISSPTNVNFIVNASTSLAGNLEEDARDLYSVMENLAAYVSNKVEVSRYALAGYSLGGIQAAFVAKLDSEKKIFPLEKVLLINPPLNLYNSVINLDRLLVDNIPGGEQNFNVWIKGVFKKLGEISKGMSEEFNADSIYKIYKSYPPREDFLAALVGTSFRLSSSNMIFATDVMNGGGYITPCNVTITSTTSLSRYAATAFRTTFEDYFNEWFYPYYKKRDPLLTKEMLIERMSLKGIESFVAGHPQIGLLHNEDDIILSSGEIEYLKKMFAGRSKIFPTGGHLGNLEHPEVIEFMTGFIGSKAGAL